MMFSGINFWLVKPPLPPASWRGLRWLGMTAFLLSLSGCEPEVQPQPLAKVSIGYVFDSSVVWQKKTLLAIEFFKRENKSRLMCANGRQIPYAINLYDVKDSPESATRAARLAINRDETSALVVSLITQSALPISRIAEQSKTPTVFAVSTHPDLGRNKDYAYRLSMSDREQALLIADFLRKKMNIGRVATVFDMTNPYNRGLAGYFEQSFALAGGQIVESIGYLPEKENYREIFERLVGRDVEIIFLPNFTDEIARQAVVARAVGIEAVLMGTDSWSINRLKQLPELEASLVFDQWHLGFSAYFPAAKDFIERFTALNNHLPEGGIASAYDAMGLLKQAICQAQSISPTEIAQALALINRYEGVSGPFEFAKNGDVSKPLAVLELKSGKSLLKQVISPKAK